MVDKADVVLAVWNGEMQGGTWNTIRYARSKGKEIRYIMLHEIGDSLYEECQFPKHDTLPHSTD